MRHPLFPSTWHNAYESNAIVLGLHGNPIHGEQQYRESEHKEKAFLLDEEK